ncbi:PIN domain-containing protein [Aeromonas enteropelogenes]|uniref:PIN domain-containing protein n=1 Tax=Aeromonas enteropelogenes TaxID=29489 RepID=UPI003B9F7111
MTEKPLTTSLSHSVEHSKVLLIDLENCPSQINELQKNLNEYSLVVICYAHSNAKIPLDWLVPLNNTINAERLKIFKMTTNGKNAADFGISFYAGMLMQQMPSNSNFVIMSDDADLDHVVNLLRNQNRIAERIGMNKEEHKPTQLAVATDATPIKIYCAHLVTYKNNRPAKKETLLNSIKNKFKDTPNITTILMPLLIKQGAVTFKENKVIYDDKKIIELSRQ